MEEFNFRNGVEKEDGYLRGGGVGREGRDSDDELVFVSESRDASELHSDEISSRQESTEADLIEDSESLALRNFFLVPTLLPSLFLFLEKVSESELSDSSLFSEWI
jgi:hypothetical protein